MYILMSIKPKYANLILQGNKTVEIRKTNIKAKIGDKVVIYSTSPQKQVVGVFTINNIQYANADKIWSFYGGYTCLTHAQFFDYTNGKNKVCAISIIDAIERKGCNLEEVISKIHLRVPQSYRFISEDVFHKLFKAES